MNVAVDQAGDTIAVTMDEIGKRARAAAAILAMATPEAKTMALKKSVEAIRTRRDSLLDANRRDMAAARENGPAESFLDRLKLDVARVEAIAASLETVADFPDPVGRVLAEWDRPNGLKISRVATPLGVIGVIFESRPNVTADAAALCLKAGNASILRAGSESMHSSRAIHACLTEGLRAAGLPAHATQLVPTQDRAAVGYMLADMTQYIDVIVPRGGKSLVGRIQAEARVPVFAHLEGLVHVYVDGAADLDMAREIIVNAKMRRTGICSATETLLIDSACARTHLDPLLKALLDAGCEVRGDQATQSADPCVILAQPEDWDTEYLDSIIAVRVVDGVDGAIAHIGEHSSNHTEAIITDDPEVAEKFMNDVDSAIVLWNASTQFADGGEFGMGVEIGIATGKLHARGPVGAEQLTSFKYMVRGAGQTRPA